MKKVEKLVNYETVEKEYGHCYQLFGRPPVFVTSRDAGNMVLRAGKLKGQGRNIFPRHAKGQPIRGPSSRPRD